MTKSYEDFGHMNIQITLAKFVWFLFFGTFVNNDKVYDNYVNKSYSDIVLFPAAIVIPSCHHLKSQ